METELVSREAAQPSSSTRRMLERVREAISTLGCSGVWARGSGPHVLLGFSGDEAFARVTPLGGSAYGLAFRTPALGSRGAQRAAHGGYAGKGSNWEPLLLIDELAELVGHALVAVDAVGI
jgi:hypothetical protein